MSNLLLKVEKKAICWSHGIALLYIFWYAPDHNEIPLTNEVEAWDTKDELRSADVTTAPGPTGQVCPGDMRGYKLSCITCSASQPTWQCPSALTSATATLPL